MAEILQQLQTIFRDVLDNDSVSISRASTGETVEGWDSLAHINIVAAVEDEFGVRFALGELQELKNIGDMIDLILQKQGKLA
ncbi:acyl carrier protein [Gemmatimonas groenlandica]|uniref:Acyl carrier protein n=1 Tax=Gemmatimonas groenlandica TaxID=2732249 RepID=A0A6M4IVI0_9BACT|nr:acyl carrier protein [Gemmatimonas groenlandica]QJR36201.1 acyl carrier protein [Gemmatimonas groenlandica]